MVAVPSFVSSNARRGLSLLEYAGDGLVPRTVREARQMAAGNISPDKVMRMAAWLARHESDLASPKAQAYEAGDSERPTPGQVAWLLWGGDIGTSNRDRARQWAERKRDQLIREGELSKVAITKATTKREDGEDFPAEAFAYVPDAETPSTWKLRLWDSLDSRETAQQVGRAVAALGPGGFRGNQVEIPAGDLARVKARVLRAWLKVNPDSNRGDAPAVLKIMVGVAKELPPSYRQTTEANVPTFKPSCASCEYACMEIDQMGRVTLSCHRWEAEVQPTGYCDAWELNDDNLPGWMMDDEDDEEMTSVDDMMYPTMKAPAGPLTEQLRVLLANVFAIYFQAHAAHWNVRGQDFSQYHSLFADIYDDVYESVDPIAENIRKLGADTPRSINELVAMRTTTEPDSTYTPQDLASALLMVNEQVLASLRSTFATADTANEQGIANFLAERIDQHQKWSWMLRASITGEAQAQPTPLTRSIRQESDGQWTVYSQSGRSFGSYNTREQALNRLAQIEQFSAVKTATVTAETLIDWHNAFHSLATVTPAHKVVHDLIEDELESRGIARPYELSNDDKIALLLKNSAGVVTKAEEQRYTLGPWYVPGLEDAHGEFTDDDTLQQALWGWVRKGDRTIYLQHSDKPAGEMVEILTVPFPVEAPLTVPGQGTTTYQFPANTPFMGVVWETWAWDMVKAGKLRGYSIGGMAQRMEAELPETALV